MYQLYRWKIRTTATFQMNLRIAHMHPSSSGTLVTAYGMLWLTKRQ